MSYQVLARKWRPRTFHELVGQEHVQRALINALDQGRLQRERYARAKRIERDSTRSRGDDAKAAEVTDASKVAEKNSCSDGDRRKVRRRR